MTPEEKRRIQLIDGIWIYLFPEGGSTVGFSKGEVERNVDWMYAHPEVMSAYREANKSHPNRLEIH